MFEPAKDFLRVATQKYKLGDQASAAWICTKVRGLIEADYPALATEIEPQKFEKGVLSIKVNNSAASSELFLRTHEIIEKLRTLNMPTPVTEIRIVRKSERQES